MNGICEATQQLSRQLENIFGISSGEKQIIESSLASVSDSLERCFSLCGNKYYSSLNFNPLHNGQYCIFLYRLSNYISKTYPEQQALCSKIYNLLKMLSGADLFYGVDLPDVFFMDHPVGTVMGRADYSDYFTFIQNCTIGNNKGIYPKLGKFVTMMSGSKVLGNCKIGNRVVISANTYIKDMDIPDNSLVFNNAAQMYIGGGVMIKTYTTDEMKKYFENTWNFENETVRKDFWGNYDET